MKSINEKEVKKEANSEKHFESKPSSDFVVGFTIGNSWTETKLEKLAIEFAEWCARKCQVSTNLCVGNWYILFDSSPKIYTTSQLFELFLNERNKK